MRIEGTCLVHFAVGRILAWNSPSSRFVSVCLRAYCPYSMAVPKRVLRALEYPKRTVVGDAIIYAIEAGCTLSSDLACAC
jgi:hypothetical protein